MFKQSKQSKETQPAEKQAAARHNGATAKSVNLIAEGTVFEGTIRAQSDVRVSGQVKGELHIKGRVIVAPEGAVEGKITATEVDISGRTQGELRVDDHLILRKTAKVEGNVEASRLSIEDGATFNGACSTMDDSKKELAKRLERLERTATAPAAPKAAAAPTPRPATKVAS